MSKEQFMGLFSLWVFVILIELTWLYVVISSINYGMVVFVITLIATTIAIGAVGIYLVSKHLE